MAYKYIDISKYQEKPDFEKIKADGVEGVIIRAGYGKNNIDEQFIRNISECNRLNIPCGVYWFSYALNVDMAKKEAEYCLAAVKPYRLELPIAFDFEYDSVAYAKKKGVNITKEMATEFVHAFCKTIEKAGYYAMNYTNQDYLSRYFDQSTLVYDLWLAVWPKEVDPDNPPRKCGIWQWGGAPVNGITTGTVDSNYAYKDYPTIIRNAGLNHLEDAENVAPSVANYATVACEKAVAKGIFKGDGEGNYRWEEPITRQDVCVVLDRLGLL